MKKLNVAIIGQGRSGRDIHGSFFKSEKNTCYSVVAVIEKDEQRRKMASSEYPGCEVYESYTEIFARNDIDLVVNASYSNEHYKITKDLLENGFNVLVEKPFSANQYECNDLIRIANEKKVILSVFMQAFYAPFYLGAREVINSGKLGDIKQIDITYSNFSRRWDWQTLQYMLGGNVFNTGPHPIGMALGFLDFDENYRVVYSKLDNMLSSGDADDYAKIILTAPNKPIIDIEISSNDAYSDSNIKILGSKGTYKSTVSEYKMKYIKDGENPPQPLIRESMKNDDGLPVYCWEKLITHEEEGKYDGDVAGIGAAGFYNALYDSLTKCAPVPVSPENAKKVIGVIETVHAQNPMSVKF